MTEELKPCPFCGGEALFDHDDEWEWIVCPSCGASTNRRVSSTEDCKPLLVEQWNRRTSGWQPIETAPKDGRSVLVAGKSGGVFICKWDGYEERWQVVHDIEDYAYCEGILDVLCPARDLCMGGAMTDQMHRMTDPPACFNCGPWEWRGKQYTGCSQNSEALNLTPGCAGCKNLNHEPEEEQ